jgi:hypothetical protein
MIYALRAKSGRPHHINHFLRRLSGPYVVLERDDENGTAVVETTGELPGYPPVLIEALPA